MSAQALAAEAPRRALGNSALAGVVLAAAALGLLAVERPQLALVAAVGGTLAIVATARVSVGILLLVAAGPVESAFNIGSGSLTVTKLAGALCFATFAANALATRRRLQVEPMHVVVLLLLGIVLLSTLHAQDMPAAVTTATRYASFVGLFFVVSQAVRTRTELTRLVWVLSISASAAGAIATYRFLSGQTSIATLAHGDPNDVAFALATTLPLTVWLVRLPGWRRAAALTMILVILGSIALTFSRGALLALGVAVLWQAIVQRRHVGVIVLGALVGILVLLLLAHLKPSQVEKGLTYKTNIAQENVSSRLEAWSAAAHLSADHPLLGVGPGNFRLHYLEATGRPHGTPPLAVVHDAYLDIAAELGPLAALVFVLYLALCFARLTEARWLQTGPPGFASALRLSLIVGMVAALTLSEQYFAPFWLIGGLAAGLHLQGRAAKPTP